MRNLKADMEAFTFHNVSIKSRERTRWCTVQITLHSTMYLLNLAGRPHTGKPHIFTFHNVSIKSKYEMTVAVRGRNNFTFHNVSIKSLCEKGFHACEIPPLHSTMYLLNLEEEGGEEEWRGSLHSTMYLLNRTRQRCETIVKNFFTFHNVSIKSEEPNQYMTGQDIPLHSTMYLLNREIRKKLDTDKTLYIPQCIY